MQRRVFMVLERPLLEREDLTSVASQPRMSWKDR